MADRDIELNLTARDQASDRLEDVADAVEAIPESATVDVDAETRQAESRIEQFDRQVEDLTDDARELRITFRSEQLQREIRNALRDLERLDDPAQIEVRTRDLERAQEELRDLADLAGRKYEVQIDADPQRSARRAADEVDLIRERGEGLQTALPALRGFTDELGATAAAGGVAGQALGDLGDFSLILGERFGISESATTKLGTALGAAGLATVVGSVLVPVLLDLIGTQDELTFSSEELLRAQEALAEGNTERAASQLADTYGELLDRAKDLGIEQQQVIDYVTGATKAFSEGRISTDESREAYRALRDDLLNARSAFGQSAEDLALATERTEGFQGALDAVVAERSKFTVAVEEEADAVEDLGDEVADTTDDVGELRDAFDRLRNRLSDRSAYLNVADAFDDITDAQLDAVEALTEYGIGSREAEEAGRALERAQIDLRTKVLEYADAVEGIPESRVTAILAAIDRGDLEEAERQLAELERTRTATVDVLVKPRVVDIGGGRTGFDFGGGVIATSGDVATRSRRTRGLPTPVVGSVDVPVRVPVVQSGDTTITVNLPRAAEARDVRTALERLARRNGRI